jgi:hypothetical protein
VAKPFAANEIFLDPRDFGAKWDGVTDDTAAIQATIDYALAHYAFDPVNPSRIGAVITLPAGTALFSDTLLIESATGMRIRGHGRRTTLLTWVGAAGVPAWKFDGTASCEISNFRMTVDGAALLDTAIEVCSRCATSSSSWAAGAASASTSAAITRIRPLPFWATARTITT